MTVQPRAYATYDVLRIGAWALVIFGALLVVVGLIAFACERRIR